MKMSDIFGKAVFVTSSEACVSPCFFGKFNAKKDAKTEIAICGLGFFRLFINGVRASSDVFAPVTSHYFSRENCYCTVQFGEIMKSRIYAIKYDISSLVRDGENEIEVSVGPGWYAEFSDKCVLCYKITSGDIETYSDKSIKWNDSPITDYSIHLGEKQDYTKHNYDKNGFSHDGLKNCDIADISQTEYYLNANITWCGDEIQFLPIRGGFYRFPGNRYFPFGNFQFTDHMIARSMRRRK